MPVADTFPPQIGRYEVVRRLGRGGMGVVYLARDPFIEREVAIKLLRAIDDDEAQERFQREIRIAGGLSHPNIVRIYDAGTHEGQPFVAMEYVSGHTLAEMIKAGAPLELDRKIELLLDLAEGLGYAHKRGIIHRDIKPSNLIVDDHGTLKILDFGIARLSDAGRTSMSAVGTPSYMAPEQILGETLDARCDLFSFGVVVYELIAYRQPFTGDSEHSVYHKILNLEPPPLTQVAPGTPAALDAFIQTALAKKPDARFQTARALADELRLIRSGLSADETVVVARPKTRPSASPGSTSGPSHDSGAGFAPLPPTQQRSPVSKRLADLRERQLNAAKDDARRALAEGRAQDAMEAAERALVLDENDAAALELAELARVALDRAEAQKAIAEAEQHLREGQLTLARQVVERARGVAPSDPDLAALEQRIATLAREREQAELQARQVRDWLDEARRRLEYGDLDGAFSSAARVLSIEPAHREALDLRAAAESALRKRQVEVEWHEAARRAVGHARELASRGALDEAVAGLEQFAPPHPETNALLAELRARQAQVADEQRRQAAAAFRQQALQRAEQCLQARDVDGALRALADLRARGILDEEVLAVEQRANDLRLAIAQERRRAAVLTRGLDGIRSALARRDPDGALLLLEQLQGDGFESPEFAALTREAESLQRQIDEERQQLIDRERRASRLADGIAEIQGAIQRRDPDAALAAVGLLRREGLDVPELAGLESQARALREELTRERQKEIERERRTARLRKGLEDVRTALTQGDADAALAAVGLLRREGFTEPDIDALEREARALQQQAEQQRAQQIAQQRRSSRLARGVADVKAALDARDADAAAAALALLEREGFSAAELGTLPRDVRALQEQLERQHRERIERERRAAQLARGLDAAREALARRDPDAAVKLVTQLKQDGLESPEFGAIQRDAKALKKQIEQERERARKASAAAAAAASAVAGGEVAAAGAQPWETAVPAPARRLLPLAAIAALVLLVAALGAWLLTRGRTAPTAPDLATPSTRAASPQAGAADTASPGTASAQPGQPGPSSSANAPKPGAETTDAAAGTTSAPGASVPPPVPTAPSAIARALEEATRQERRGDLLGASRTLASVIQGSSRESAEFRAAVSGLRGLANRAQQRAEAARLRAEEANAVGTDDFLLGARTVTQARQVAARDPETAIARYLDAESAFDRARASVASPTSSPAPSAQQATPQQPIPPVAQPVPSPIRETPRPEPAPTTPPAQTQPSPATPPSAATPTPAPGPDPAAQRQVDAVVRRYFAARSNLDLAGMQAVYPSLPTDRERDGLRRIGNACSEFSEQPQSVQVLSMQGAEAIVRAQVQVTCRARAGSSPPVRTADITVFLSRSGANWVITQVNRPDQAR